MKRKLNDHGDVNVAFLPVFFFSLLSNVFFPFRTGPPSTSRQDFKYFTCVNQREMELCCVNIVGNYYYRVGLLFMRGMAVFYYGNDYLCE